MTTGNTEVGTKDDHIVSGISDFKNGDLIGWGKEYMKESSFW